MLFGSPLPPLELALQPSAELAPPSNSRLFSIIADPTLRDFAEGQGQTAVWTLSGCCPIPGSGCRYLSRHNGRSRPWRGENTGETSPLNWLETRHPSCHISHYYIDKYLDIILCSLHADSSPWRATAHLLRACLLRDSEEGSLLPLLFSRRELVNLGFLRGKG